MKISGIYMIQSKIKPKRVYVGSAIDIKDRKRCHLKSLRKNEHHSKKLQRHFNKYGESDLIFSILLGCDKEELLKTEQYFIDSHNPYFNILKIAGSTLGHVVSEESKEKMRKAKIGKLLSEEHKEKIRLAGLNRHPSPETRKKLSLSKLGKPCPHKGVPCKPITRKKLRLANSGKPCWLKGRRHSPESIEKNRLAHLNKKCSEETRRKMSIARKGYKMSDETKAKISLNHSRKSAWNKGKCLTEEHRRNISKSRKYEIYK